MSSHIILAGEYVVVLHDPNKNNNWKNYCFKQHKDSDDICPESTPNYPNNSESDSESYSCRREHWRYATDEEIARYDTEGIFKITTKPKKPSVVKINNYPIW